MTFTKKYAIISSVLKVHKYSFNKVNGVNINSVELTKDANDLYFRKGQINILGTVLNLENQITNAHSEALTEQPSQEDFEL